MKPGEPVCRSPLDKPLTELTEEDISQLTREDCRKYLKDKGMRRPSWNKSQAIQQVISLKTLLESRPDSGDAAPAAGGVRSKNLPSPVPENPLQIEPAPANESASDRSRDGTQQSSGSGDASCQTPATGKVQFPIEGSISPPCGATRGGGVGGGGQMTIFYDGKVNVYEGVAPDKARMIMQLAAGGPTGCLPCDVMTSSVASPVTRIVPCVRESLQALSPPPQSAVVPIPPQSQTGKTGQHTTENMDDGIVPCESEGPANRKASLQRYLEKRKDRVRFKHKKKMGGSSSSSLEMYINQQVRTQTSNGQLSRSDTSSPTQPKPPHTPTRCSSVENLPKNLCLSVDLNDDGLEEGGQD